MSAPIPSALIGSSGGARAAAEGGFMITIAVTGGIGAGKSTVSAALRDRGAVVIDSDRLAREVVEPGTPGLAAIADAFGPAMIGRDGALDRAALAATVFADRAARRRLEEITHPLVRARFAELQRAAPTDAVVVNDIPLLTTMQVAASFHLVLGVVADAEVRVERLVSRGLAADDARARMAAQLTDDERAALCDVTLHNHGDVDALRSVIGGLWTGRLVPFEKNVRAGRPAARGRSQPVPSDPTWPATAARLAARVSAAVGGARVDHIGPTAVPGMPGTDVIDLQLTVPDLAVADEWAEPLAAAGFPRVDGVEHDVPYSANPARADEHRAADEPAADERAADERVDDEPHRWVKRLHANADPEQKLNLHLRVRDSANWRWALLCKDWLAAEAGEAESYAAATKHMAAGHPSEMPADVDVEPGQLWIDAAYRRGLAWAHRAGWAPSPG